MTPKELRNLKQLIKSGDEDNIRLFDALANDRIKIIVFGWLSDLHTYCYRKYLQSTREECRKFWNVKMRGNLFNLMVLHGKLTTYKGK